jgi:hypothetical protein
MRIEYNGKYPNLCSGNLVVIIDDKRWEFPDYCLSSGGSVWFNGEWQEHVSHGPWSIYEWPEGFPEALKDSVIEEINYQISHGCCGGCI